MKVTTFYLDKIILKDTNQLKYGKGKVRRESVFLSLNSQSMKKRDFKQRPVRCDPLVFFREGFLALL